MPGKWTYIDFLMYLLPGGYALVASLCAIAAVTALPKAFFDSASLTLAGGVIVAFLAGNLVQAASHRGAEKRLKKKHWGGEYPSVVMFFEENCILGTTARASFLAALEKLGLLPTGTKAAFDQTLPKTGGKGTASDGESDTKRCAIGQAQDVFDYARVALLTTDYGGRIRNTEGYFLLFRGLFVVAWWSALAFVAALAFNLLRDANIQCLAWLGEVPSKSRAYAMPVVCSSLCWFSWWTFRDRCRGAAVGFAKEVQRAAVAMATFVPPNAKK
jgi:hypothetical protein